MWVPFGVCLSSKQHSPFPSNLGRIGCAIKQPNLKKSRKVCCSFSLPGIIIRCEPLKTTPIFFSLVLFFHILFCNSCFEGLLSSNVKTRLYSSRISICSFFSLDVISGTQNETKDFHKYFILWQPIQILHSLKTISGVNNYKEVGKFLSFYKFLFLYF